MKNLTSERRKQLREFAVYLNNQYKLGVFTKEKARKEFKKKLNAFKRVSEFECYGFCNSMGSAYRGDK